MTLADGRTAMVTDPRLRLPLLPGFKGQGDPSAYYGAGIYPTMFLDVDGSTALATAVFPTGPRSCRLVTEYLFSPEALEDPGFDPSPVVEFNELRDPAGQRGLRARPARRHLTRVRPRRLPGQGLLGARLRRALPPRRRGA